MNLTYSTISEIARHHKQSSILKGMIEELSRDIEQRYDRHYINHPEIGLNNDRFALYDKMVDDINQRIADELTRLEEGTVAFAKNMLAD